jgi:hypothetical protein
MTRDEDTSAAIAKENIIEYLLRANILVYIHLAVQSLQQCIVIGKSVLERVRWESIVDVGLAAAAIAGMGR